MDARELHPSRFLSGDDLQGKVWKRSISAFRIEELNGERKGCIELATPISAKSTIVLNKTNSTVLMKAYGHETDNWLGHDVEVYPSEVSFRGEIKTAVRIRKPLLRAEAVEDTDIDQ